MEEWRKVPWAPNYEASTRGDIRSLGRTTVTSTGAARTTKTRTLKPTKNTTGRLCVTIFVDGVGRQRAVHRLVCEAFHGPPPEGKPWALHRNGDHRDNRPENLYWGSPRDNARDMMRHGTHWVARQTHCPRGHEKTPENIYVRPDGKGSMCRECVRLRSDRYLDEGPPPPESDLHGRYSTYARYGCRCESCSKANKDYWEKFKEVELQEGDSRHGVTGYMSYDCRCAVCVSATKEAWAKSRAAKKDRELSAGDPRHGTTRGYWAGCKCGPCKGAYQIYSAERRRQEKAMNDEEDA